MAADAKLVLARRTSLGTPACRRLRRQGKIPGNVYGHGQDPVSVSIAEESIEAAVHGSQRVFEIEFEGTSDTDQVMFRELQWNAFGTRIRHFDLLRIDPNETVTIEVPVELRGTAAGTGSGGLLEQSLRTLTLECQVSRIPESIVVRINHLEVGDAIHVSEIEVPEGAMIQNPPEAAVVQVVAPVVEEEDEEAVDAAPAEPEVIGRQAEESE
jgi:large subunit ribosomal protein L25